MMRLKWRTGARMALAGCLAPCLAQPASAKDLKEARELEDYRLKYHTVTAGLGAADPKEAAQACGEPLNVQ